MEKKSDQHPNADEVDIAHWNSISGMLKENCPSQSSSVCNDVKL